LTAAEKPNVLALSIPRIVGQAVLGDIDIPEFQRDFVWEKDKVKDLLDSLLKGYPIGSFLIWDLGDYTTGKHVFEGKKKEWIVDGQQRIVTLCILKGKKPYWLDVKTWNNLLARYKVKVDILTLGVSLEFPPIKNNPQWVYVHEILDLQGDDNVVKAAEGYATNLHKPDLFPKIYSNLKAVQDAFSRDIAVIKINTSLESVATIFERLNSAGTRVKFADVTLAFIAAYNEGWIRSKFQKYIEGLDDEGFYFEPTLLIRALTSVGENKAVLRDVSEDFKRNKDGILDVSFEKLKFSINSLIQNFRTIGLLSSDLIYAKNTVIPIVYLHSKFQMEFEFKKAFHYFLLALAGGRYSGSAETTLQEDINTINGSSTFAEAITKLHTSVKPINKDPVSLREAVYYQGEGRFLKLVLYLVAHKNQAYDWFTNTRIGYLPSNEINKDFTIEEHHFFPKGLLRNVGVSEDKRDTLVNITFINPGTNKRLRDEPYVYIKRFNINKDELAKQMIPVDNEELWRLKNYDAFLEERSKLIAESIKEFMEDLYPTFYEEPQDASS